MLLVFFMAHRNLVSKEYVFLFCILASQRTFHTLFLLFTFHNSIVDTPHLVVYSIATVLRVECTCIQETPECIALIVNSSILHTKGEQQQMKQQPLTPHTKKQQKSHPS